MAVNLSYWFMCAQAFRVSSSGLFGLCSTMSQMGLLYQIPQYFVAVARTSSTYAGLHLIPNAVLCSVTSLYSGIHMSYTGKYKRMLVIMHAMNVLGPFLMTVS